MLSLLHIENVAVVEKADIEFGSGFNVMTGETGAGKSIVIDSLEAALGYRTSKELVRSGADKAVVTAVFSDTDLGDYLESSGIEPEEEIVLTRRITADGKSACRVNGVPVSAAQLRDLGSRLMDIHAQSDGQRLMDERCHGTYLDAFGCLELLLREYRAAFDEYRKLSREMEKLVMDESEKERRLDTLSFQIEELENANLMEGEYDEKLTRRTFLKNVGKLSESVMDADNALSGGDNEDGAVALISVAADSIGYALRYSEDFSALSEKLINLKFAAEDAAEELRDMKERLDFSPSELDELDERLSTLKRIQRKYGGSEKDAIEFLERAKTERDAIEYSEERVKKLETEVRSAREKAVELAERLTESRTDAGRELSKRIESELNDLSMKGARFAVEITPAELSASGADNVRFLMSANAGEKLGRMSKIASGGELSRIMLAVKSVLAGHDRVQSMVFDEIDAGISGIAAQRVAEKMSCIAGNKQVICVTHLPQITAMADTHFRISKRLCDGRTFTEVTELDTDGRREELARMIGGDNIQDATLMAAEEQLKSAAEFKKTRGTL